MSSNNWLTRLAGRVATWLKELRKDFARIKKEEKESGEEHIYPE